MLDSTDVTVTMDALRANEPDFRPNFGILILRTLPLKFGSESIALSPDSPKIGADPAVLQLLS